MQWKEGGGGGQRAVNVLESGKGGLGEESLVKEGRGKNPVGGGGVEKKERER